MSVSISGDGSLSGIDQGLNVVGVVTATTLNVGTGASIGSPATNVLTLGTNNVEALRIDSSGNIGVNSTSPSAIVGSGKILNITNTGHATISIQAIDSVNDRNSVLELLSSGNGSSESKIVYGDTDTTPGTSSPLVFYGRHSGTTTEKLRIKSDGKTGINNTNPLSTLSVGTRTSDVSDTSLIFSAGGSSSGGEVLAATFCNTASGASNNATAISFTCRNGDSQTAKIVAKQPSGASSPNTQLDFYVYNNSGSTKVVTFDQNGRVLMPYQPCFQASGSQNTTYSAQVVPFNVSLTNNGSNYSTSTYRFTAPVAGHYFFTLHAILGPDGSYSAQLHMRRNGTRVATVHRNTSTSTSTWEQGACSAVLYLNVSDYVDCYIESGTIYLGSNITGGEVYSALNGYLIG